MRPFCKMPTVDKGQIEVSFAYNPNSKKALVHFYRRHHGEYKIFVYEVPTHNILLNLNFTNEEQAELIEFCHTNESSLLMLDKN